MQEKNKKEFVEGKYYDLTSEEFWRSIVMPSGPDGYYLAFSMAVRGGLGYAKGRSFFSPSLHDSRKNASPFSPKFHFFTPVPAERR